VRNVSILPLCTSENFRTTVVENMKELKKNTKNNKEHKENKIKHG
jgi:hypothetical protein